MDSMNSALMNGRLDDAASASFFKRTVSRHLLALALGLLPVYGFGLYSHLTRQTSYTLQEMLLYPLVLGTTSVLWISLLNRVLLNQSLRDFNLKKGTWSRDTLIGLLLTAGFLLLFYLQQFTVNQWLPRSSRDVLSLLYGLAENPLLLMLWLGPTVWIGVACFEEISRAFLLKGLWAAFGGRAGQWCAILGSGLFFGVIHSYQGPAGMVSVGMLSVLQGWFYWRFGRLWPLIMAHALYDSIQIIWVVSLIWRGYL
jgi:membrane protease YdiL (CAAX protease family)